MAVVRPWGKLSSSDLDFASADSAMGHTADLALGIALAQPDRRVICINGDGSMLMTLGTLTTVVHSDAKNYILIVTHNDSYEITGHQPIPGAGRVDFVKLAQGAGLQKIYSFDEGEEFAQKLPEILSMDGPVFVVVQIERGDEGPISFSENEQAYYLKTSLTETAHRLRRALLMESGE
jgi:thiamine pyrophosphate-dependent acetolactate synthase large subunit-like protein